jgi:ParB family chromosome partitioning protein
MTDDTTTQTAVPAAARRKPQALGRGLQALLGESRREEPVASAATAGGATATTNVVSIESGLAQLTIAMIEPDPDQPRRHFDETALNELAASIAARGVIQPVIVRPLGEGRYRLVAGERRWRAAQRAQLHEIPALVRKLSDREVMALALIENLQREDLNPIEEARAYQRLAESEGMTQADIARMVDKSRSHVANIQRLLSLPESVVRMVEGAELTMGHARALIGAEDPEGLAKQAVAKGLSVREVEQLVRTKAGREVNPQRRAREEYKSNQSADIAAMEAHLEEFLGLSVKINADADPRSGAVTIRYRTLDQLDLICQRLTGEGI